MLPNKGGPAMNENIVIPIKTCRLKLWTRWMLETTGWLISLGLLAASAAVSVIAAMAWLVSGSNTLLVLGMISGLSLGLAGVWHVLRRLDRAASLLKQAPSEVA